MNLRTLLYRSVSEALGQCNITVIFQSKNRLKNLFKFKDSILLYHRYFAPTLFINFSVVTAMITTIARRNFILK